MDYSVDTEWPLLRPDATAFTEHFTICVIPQGTSTHVIAQLIEGFRFKGYLQLSIYDSVC